MKKLLFSTAISSFIATGAFAGSTVYEAPEVAAIAAGITDWSGAYAGVTGGFITNGTGTYLYPNPGDVYDISGSMYGVFGGYNIQRGSLVYGGEVAAQFGTYELDNGFGSHFSNMFDAKARVGYVLGKAMMYGFAGYSFGHFDNQNTAGTTTPNGLNYGAGIDYLVSDRLFLGLEYIGRDMTGWFENTAGINPNFGTVQLRAGMKF